MSKGDSLGEFEQLVVMAVLHLDRDAYGMTVRRLIEQRAARSVSLGAVYATLDRLEHKRLVRSTTGGTAAAREGRARRYFSVTGSGKGLLQKALSASDRMRDSLPGFARPSEAP